MRSKDGKEPKYNPTELWEKAVEYFEKTLNSPNSMMRDEALYHLGWLYDKLGQSEKSKQAFNKIISDHPDFIYIDLVKEQISG